MNSQPWDVGGLRAFLTLPKEMEMQAQYRSWKAATLAATVVLLVANLAMADAWISVTPAAGTDGAAVPPQLVTREFDETGLHVTYSVPGLALEPRKTKGGEFVQVTWPGAAYAGAMGTPKLPVIRELFIVPDGAEVVLTTTMGAQPVVLTTELHGRTFLAMPAQPPVPKLPGAAEAAEFAFDAAAYAQDAGTPAESVIVHEVGIARGQRLFMLEIHPIAYNPVAQTLTVQPSISVDLDFVGGSGAPSKVDPLPGLNRVVLNPGPRRLESRGSGNYLIIVATTFETAIAGFATAKEAQGFDVTTYAVAPGTSNTSIKNYISGLYGGPDSPDYVLLVGDTNTIPHWVGSGAGSPDTDLNYVCVDGSDYVPDIAIGRFPVRSTTDVNTIVDKTLTYENGPLTDPDYIARAVFMAGVDNNHITEGTHEYCITTYLEPYGYTCDRLYEVTYGADTQDVRDSFNDGRFYGVFSGHGGTYSWADGPVFSQSDVNGLTNLGMYAFVCSFACITGTYTATECFMETWVLAPNKAAICSWGSSVNSYWTEDDILQRVLFDAIFDDGDAVEPEAGPIYNEAKIRYLAYFGDTSTTRRYFEMYNLMGDPSVELPTTLEAGLEVSPGGGLNAEGESGGPFTPDSIVYTLENMAEYAIDYQVTHNETWVTVTNATGNIPSQGSTTVTVSINSEANSFGNGTYSDTVYFTNLTDHEGDCTRAVTLTVGLPSLAYRFPMDSDPGWSTEGQWAFGQPTGGGGQYGYSDPTSGYTGDNVYGYNLSGDYANSMPEYDLTTTALDCSELSQVTLKFQRWLGVEQPSYDHAYIRVSNNGSNFTTVWENGAEVADSGWSQQKIDISEYADYQATVYIRWTMGTTDGSWQFCGWNIDDVEIWAIAPEQGYDLGDMNCDGFVNGFDIDPFVMVVGGELTDYYAAYPDCDHMLGDINDDGNVDGFDIDPFVVLVGG